MKNLILLIWIGAINMNILAENKYLFFNLDNLKIHCFELKSKKIIDIPINKCDECFFSYIRSSNQIILKKDFYKYFMIDIDEERKSYEVKEEIDYDFIYKFPNNEYHILKEINFEKDNFMYIGNNNNKLVLFVENKKNEIILRKDLVDEAKIYWLSNYQIIISYDKLNKSEILNLNNNNIINLDGKVYGVSSDGKNYFMYDKLDDKVKLFNSDNKEILAKFENPITEAYLIGDLAILIWRQESIWIESIVKIYNLKTKKMIKEIKSKKNHYYFLGYK